MNNRIGLMGGTPTANLMVYKLYEAPFCRQVKLTARKKLNYVSVRRSITEEKWSEFESFFKINFSKTWSDAFGTIQNGKQSTFQSFSNRFELNFAKLNSNFWLFLSPSQRFKIFRNLMNSKWDWSPQNLSEIFKCWRIVKESLNRSELLRPFFQKWWNQGSRESYF